MSSLDGLQKGRCSGGVPSKPTEEIGGQNTHSTLSSATPSELHLPFLSREDIMKIFTSKNFSLACTVFNTGVAVSLFANGNHALGALCALFACMCARNYWRG